MRLRKALRKIHRWVGLLSALWLLQLAVTGLLLQHADDFNLTQMHVSSPKVLQWFGYGTRQQIITVQDQNLYQIDEVVGFDEHKIPITGQLVAAVRSIDIQGQDLWVLATANSLYWINPQGEIIQQLDDFDGLPTPVSGLFSAEGKVNVAKGKQWYQLLKTGDFVPLTGQFSSPEIFRSMSSAEQDQYFEAALQGKLSYDKVLHGIHAGIQGSKWLNSLSALALLYLSVSGIYLFFKQPKRKR